MAKRKTKAEQEQFLEQVFAGIHALDGYAEDLRDAFAAEPVTCLTCHAIIGLEGVHWVCGCDGYPTVDPRELGKILAAGPDLPATANAATPAGACAP